MHFQNCIGTQSIEKCYSKKHSTAIYTTNMRPFLHSKRGHETADLNQIFHGPPGTGKTFNTINAASVIDRRVFGDAQRRPSSFGAKIQGTAANHSHLGRQIAFTTFHQSEHIKKISRESNLDINNTDESSLTYRIEHGIFKRLCSVAENNNFDDPQEKREPIISDNPALKRWKMSLGESGDDIEAEIGTDYCIKHNFIATGWGAELTAGLNRDEIDVKFEGMAKFHAMAMKRFAVRMLAHFVLISNGNKSIPCFGRTLATMNRHGESPPYP